MTLKEIAARVGTSPSTVSRVLNGYRNNFSVTPELKAQILREVELTGYLPNPVFRSMRTEKDRQISFMFYDNSMLRSGSVVGEALDVISRMLLENGFLYNYTFAPEARAKCYPLPHWKMAGLVIPDVLEPSQLEVIEQNNYPYVGINGYAGVRGTAVMSDEIANMRLAMEYLINYGHRRIGYIDVRFFRDSYLHHSIKDRRQGYTETVTAHNLEEIYAYHYVDGEVGVPLRQMLDQKVTAIVTYDERIALKVLYDAWRNGIKVPDDLSVITFNNPENLNYSIPPLSCVEIAAHKMGAVAAELIMRKVNEPDCANGEIIKLPGRLVLRESVKAIASRK